MSEAHYTGSIRGTTDKIIKEDEFDARIVKYTCEWTPDHDRSLCSPEFETEDVDHFNVGWTIICEKRYPDGKNDTREHPEGCWDHILFVRNYNAEKVVRAKVSLIKDNGSEVSIVKDEDFVPARYERRSFKKRGVVNVPFTIKLRLEISVKAEHENLGSGIFELSKHMGKILADEKLCDVTFVIGKEELKAHKLILSARNQAFATMFGCGMIENRNDKVKVDDIDIEIFRELLNYLYSGEVQINKSDEWMKLFIAANKYSIDSLMRICEKSIMKSISTENAIDILILADLHSQNLKVKVIDFISKNKQQLTDSGALKSLAKTHLNLLIELINNIE